MSKHDLQKEKLDDIGRKLLAAGRITNDELERIVHAPRLFEAVKARIKAEQKPPPKGKVNFFVWNFQTASGAFAILIVLFAVAAGIVSKTRNAPPTVENIHQTEVPLTAGPTENPPPVPVEMIRTKAPSIKKPAAAQKIDFKVQSANAPEKVKKPVLPKTEPSSKKDLKVVFYPLEVAGSWEAAGEDLRVVRAELSRAELFALGVNLPVENESARVKTDLLVGADGVARAIRLVE